MSNTDKWNADNPWMGLDAYDEGQRLFGRDKEAVELTNIIRNNTSVVVYGKSGIGKSSLLRAGVFPLLRQFHFVPIHLRLLHNTDIPYTQQIENAIAENKNIVVHDLLNDTIPPLGLWDYLHRHKFTDRVGNDVFPVIVLDQFEEIFTLTQPDHKIDINTFFTELADVLNDVKPDTIIQQEADYIQWNSPQRSLGNTERKGFVVRQISKTSLAYQKHPIFRIVISLRDDSLYMLERKTFKIPALKLNRFNLTALDEDCAKDVIMNPRPGLISESEGQDILDSLANYEYDDFKVVDPAILSLFLYSYFQEKGKVAFSDIFERYYNECTKDISQKSVAYIEDKLLTDRGNRNQIPAADLLSEGVGQSEMEHLLNRKILKIENRKGTDYVEYSHDRLCEQALKHRKERNLQEQNIKMRKRMAIAACTIALSLGIAAVFAWLVLINKETNKELSLSNHLLEQQKDSIRKTLDALELEKNEKDKAYNELEIEKNAKEKANNELVFKNKELEKAKNEKDKTNRAMNEKNKELELAINERDIVSQTLLVKNRELEQEKEKRERANQNLAAINQALVARTEELSKSEASNVVTSANHAIDMGDSYHAKEILNRYIANHTKQKELPPHFEDAYRRIENTAVLKLQDMSVSSFYSPHYTSNPNGDIFVYSDHIHKNNKEEDIIYVFDMNNLQYVDTIECQRVWKISFSPTEDLLAISDAVKDSIILWNRKEKIIQTISGHLFDFSKDGKSFVVANYKTYNISNIENGSRNNIQYYETNEYIQDIRFSYDNQQIITEHSNNIKIRDIKNSVLKKTLYKEVYGHFIFSPDSRFIFGIFSDNENRTDKAKRIIDLQTNKDIDLEGKFELEDLFGDCFFQPRIDNKEGLQFVSRSKNTQKIWLIPEGKLIHDGLLDDDFLDPLSFASSYSKRGIRDFNNFQDYIHITDIGRNQIKIKKKKNKDLLNNPYSHANSIAYNSKNNSLMIVCDRKSLLNFYEKNIDEFSSSNLIYSYSPAIKNISFSHNGQYIIGICQDFMPDRSVIRIWDVKSQKMKKSIRIIGDRNRDEIKAIFDITDQRIIYTVNNHLYIIDWKSGFEYAKVELPETRINNIYLNTDGTKLIASSGSKIYIFDAKTLFLHNTINEHLDWVNSISFSPDGTKMLTASSDSTIKVFDIKSSDPKEWRMIKTKQYDYSINDAFYVRNGTNIITNGHGTSDLHIQLTDCETYSIVKDFNHIQDNNYVGGINNIFQSNDGKELVVNSLSNNNISFYSIEEGKPTNVWSLPYQDQWGFLDITLNPDDSSVVASDFNGNIYRFKKNSPFVKNVLVKHVSVTSDGLISALILKDTFNEYLYIQNAEKQEITSIEIPFSKYPAQISSNGKYIARTFDRNVIETDINLWKIQNNEIKLHKKISDSYFLSFSSDGKKIAYTDHCELHKNYDVIIEDLERGDTICLSGCNTVFNEGVFNLDDNIFAGYLGNNTIIIWNLKDKSCKIMSEESRYINLSGGAALDWYNGPFNSSNKIRITTMCLSPNSKYLLVGHNDGLLTLYNTDELSVIQEFHNDYSATDDKSSLEIKQAFFTSDEKKIISLNKGGDISTWDFPTLNELKEKFKIGYK